jgi:hypothetical protein
MEDVDRGLPEQDHGEVHDQDDRDRSCRPPSVTRHHRFLSSPSSLPRGVVSFNRLVD